MSPRHTPACKPERGIAEASSSVRSPRDVAQSASRAQDPALVSLTSSATIPLAAGDIALAAIWRGPRDRSRAIQLALRNYNGTQYLDVREYRDSCGFMTPTTRGITISPAQLPKFAAAVGAALRKAHALGIVTARSS